MKVVIFAGGVGTRLWPLSRKNTPKQFEKIIDDKSTLQLAFQRIASIVKPEDVYISSGIGYKDIILSQLPQISRENFIFEPVMRDIGAAVGLVTAILAKTAPSEPFMILWSDHLVKNVALFREVLLAAGKILEKDKNKIVFIGQTSRFGSQNLGWIEQGSLVKNLGDLSLYEFKSFHYRPDLETAEKFHASRSHFWNPGYFGTTPDFLFSLYKTFTPSMYAELVKIQNAWGTADFEKTLNEIYPTLEKISFDNLILEKINPKDGLVLGADLGWSDVGAWEQLKEALADKKEDNATKGKVLLTDSSDNLVFNYTDQMTVGIDLKNLLVINTEDVLLVCPKDSVPKIKKLVESLAGTPNEKLT
ncbi:MAG: sugar phosphate nucleotidyltransferase [Candidatus Levyibacteriota bacterium]|jgi:mannose-1-phosphate guanylyltransferase